jgi:uncharacterized protein with PIN domain
MKFAADSMLGKLAKWLRILGYDTLYARALSDKEFLQLARDDRVLLSRNSQLKRKMSKDNLVFIEENDPNRQLQTLVHSLDLPLDPERFFTRCTICNGQLEHISREDVAGKVPDYIWGEHNHFSECGDCGKIYWPGSHMVRSREEILQLLGVS